MYALRLAGCFHLRALKTFGLMGWLTDFMSAFPGGDHACERGHG
jgi:hypothetical protein